MNKNIAWIIVILVVILGAWFLLGRTTNAPTTTTGQPNQTSQNTNTPQLFANSQFAQNAYLISTDNYDAPTKQALSGFRVTKKTLANGSMEITLNATNPEYHTQVYTVKPGEKLYFIERMLGDDTGTEDLNIRDDTAVLVDASGYIVQQ